jgi:hypothetical protein
MGADEIGSVSAARRERRDVRIRGPWFSVARVVLIAMALLMLGLTAAGFVAGLRHWELIGSRSIYSATTAAGIPVTATTLLGLALPHLVYATIGIVIFLRRSGDWSAMVFALALIAPTTFRPLLALERASPMLSVPVEIVWLFAILVTHHAVHLS